MTKLPLLCAVLAAAIPAAGRAQPCPAYLGQTVTLTPVAVAVARMKAFARHFEASVIATGAAGDGPEDDLILRGVLAAEQLTYDSDRSSLLIAAPAFGRSSPADLGFALLDDQPRDAVETAVIERTIGIDASVFVEREVGPWQVVARVPMAAGDARRLRANARVAYVAKASPPYYTERTTSYRWHIGGPATTTVHHALVADIRCALLLSAENKVVATLTTQ